MNTFSISKALSTGWSKTGQHFWTFFGLLLILIGATIAISFLSAVFLWMPVISGLIVFAIEILAVFVNLALMMIFLRIARGEKLSFDNIVDEFSGLFSTKNVSASGGKNLSFVANFAVIAVFYGLIVMLGLVAFVIPGIYLAIKYSQVLFMVADKKKPLPSCKNMKLSESLRKAFKEYKQTFHEAGEMMRGQKLHFLGFGLALFLISLLAIIPGFLTLGLGFIFMALMMRISLASVYLQLSENKSR